MSSEIKIINPIDYPNWDDLIKVTDGDVFSNTTAWAKTLSETYGYKPIYFTVFEKNRLVALLPVIEVNSILTGLRGVSLPFTDYCNPIIDSEIQFHDLLNRIMAYGKKRSWEYFEFRNGEKYLHDFSPASTYFRHTLDLPGDEKQIFSSFRQSTRRNIKKATQKEVKVTFCRSLDAIKKYHNLHCITRKRQGIPPQPFKFFKKIHENIIAEGGGLIVLGEFHNKVIAGAIFINFGRNVSFKFGASNRNYQNLRANNLIMWEAIKYYCQNGYKRLCFGRTDMNNDGLRQFKLGWGTKENLSNYYIYDIREKNFVKNAHAHGIRPLYNKIFGTMPIPLLKLSGNLLYRHIG